MRAQTCWLCRPVGFTGFRAGVLGLGSDRPGMISALFFFVGVCMELIRRRGVWRVLALRWLCSLVALACSFCPRLAREYAFFSRDMLPELASPGLV